MEDDLICKNDLKELWEIRGQAGAELFQAQFKLG